MTMEIMLIKYQVLVILKMGYVVLVEQEGIKHMIVHLTLQTI